MSASVYHSKDSPPCVIYKITNIVNWKGYVGQTRTGLSKRIASYKWESRYGKGHIIASAMKKYGLEKFFFQILEACENADPLDARERFWIAACGTLTPRGYNVEKGGGVAKEVSLETRRKISLAGKGRPGRPLSDYHKQRLREGQIAGKGTVVSDARKKQLSDQMKGAGNFFFGRKHSEETKRKISRAKLGVPVHDDQWRRNHSAMLKGRKLSSEHVKNLKAGWVVRKKRGWKYIVSPETRLKLSESSRMAWAKRKEKSNA